MKLFTLLALLIAIIAGLFALQNATPVFVQFLGWKTQSSMALILLVTFALGVLFGFLISLPTMIQRMRKIAHFRSQAEQLAYDLDVANRKLSEASAPPTDHPNISQAYRKVTCNSLPARLLADQAK